MNLEQTVEQSDLRETLRRYLLERASVATYVRPLIAEPAAVKDDVWQGLADLGAAGLLIPAELGGAGLTMAEVGAAAEEFGAGLYLGPWLSSAVAAVRALTRLDTGEVGGALMTDIASGSVTATVAGILGDDPRPTATEHDGQWILDGQIDGVRDLKSADVLLVLADEQGLGQALFQVSPNSRGLRCESREFIDPTTRLFTLKLDGAPAQRITAATPDEIEDIRDDILIASAADALGAARAVMELAVDYAKVRHQFGKPIGSFQAVQHLCADMYETVELARGGVIHALWAADAGERFERHLAALRAKGFAAELVSIADTAIQIFGGIGYTWDHDAHLYLKRLLGFSELAGSPDSYLQKIGTSLVHSMAAGSGPAQ
ncbi:acyl-CoA dehydrogenase family protein [soil metagenome]